MGVVRFVLALTYLFSGVVKLNDPRGTQYKIEDYGTAFGMSRFLPDGVPCGTLGCSYRSHVNFTAFATGATITSV